MTIVRGVSAKVVVKNNCFISKVDVVTGTPGKFDDFVSTGKMNLDQVCFDYFHTLFIFIYNKPF